MLQTVHQPVADLTMSAEAPRLLMCAPAHFAVRYSINPWMDPVAWAEAAARDGGAVHAKGERQWTALHAALVAAGAVIETVLPVDDLPDLVFTANAAVVLNGTALLARFRYPERQGEEPVFARAFEALRARGLITRVATMPDGVVLEGAGDCLFDAARDLFWMGFGPRSDAGAATVVAETFGVPVVPLQLVDPRFYHLDTALCPLPSGHVIYVPAAFTADGRKAIEAHVPEDKRIALDEADAVQFAANAVCVGQTIVMSRCSDALRERLTASGYEVVETPLDTFLQSGGSAACLTLRLDRHAAHSALRAG
jgi:N-dimethylarginine dimethylaminohydrolase